MSDSPPPTTEALMGAADIRAALEEMSEAISKSSSGDEAVLIGIQRRGVELAERMAEMLDRGSLEVQQGALDITLYRDDLETVGPKPVIGETFIPCDLNGRFVVIVDDVLYTGRTVRAALAELVDFGRPARVALCVLIDRGGRELPIQADIVGRTVPAGPNDRVDVYLEEVDGRDAVEVVRGWSS